MDKLKIALSRDGMVRAYVIDSTETVETMRATHKTARTVTAALGRLITAASMMGAMLKNDNESVTLQIKGDGLAGSLVAASKRDASVRGYCVNPDADKERKPNGKLDVSGIIGNGELTVIKDLGLKNPFVGKIELVSGEIAEDIAAYFVLSEQTPSAVSLGVLTADDRVIAAGGYIVQPLPGISDADIEELERRIKEMPPVSSLIEDKKDPNDILTLLFGENGYDIAEELDPCYKCDCSNERVRGVVASLGRDEIRAMIEEDGKAELCCNFCNKKYHFNKDELESILTSL